MAPRAATDISMLRSARAPSRNAVKASIACHALVNARYMFTDDSRSHDAIAAVCTGTAIDLEPASSRIVFRSFGTLRSSPGCMH
jgi:hypothetical protein